MPYQTSRGGFEPARKLGHVPIVESEFVKNRLQNYRVFGHETAQEVAGELMASLNSLPEPRSKPDWAMSFDGSIQEVSTNSRFPSTRVGYVQVAGVLVHLKEMLGQSQQLFVDPVVIRLSARQSLFSVVLPGSNVSRTDMETVRDSWRAEVYEMFRDYRVEDQSMLAMFMKLLAAGDRSWSGGAVLRRCSANTACVAENILVPEGGQNCPSCGGMLFPTDALRIHEEVQELTGNLTALGRLMTVLEQVTLLCYLDFLLEHQPRALSNVAFIVDGPLALFGPPAPFKRAILAYIQLAAQQLKRRNYAQPLILGIEKTGHFVEHAQEISRYLPNQTLMRIPDTYIFQRILATRSTNISTYGEDTYYGRKFFYKTMKGQMLAITVPCLDESLKNNHTTDDAACYETLPTTLALLDEIGTKLYQDAIIPVALAHSYAVIPLKTGSKVLTLLSKEFLGQSHSA